MPIVEIKTWKGVSEDAAKHMISGITKVLGELGIPERAVHIVIHEIPKMHWGMEGKPASIAMPDAPPLKK
ncbi:MAG: tautomerase family protein [Candidatus Thorarchaeota archaeon]|jgi:4-oxalocrotonate tautomerase family enzyme